MNSFTYRVDQPKVIPFTREGPFVNAFKKSFEKMRKVGILSDIIKRYETKEEVECAGPKVFYYEFFNYLFQLGQR